MKIEEIEIGKCYKVSSQYGYRGLVQVEELIDRDIQEFFCITVQQAATGLEPCFSYSFISTDFVKEVPLSEFLHSQSKWLIKQYHKKVNQWDRVLTKERAAEAKAKKKKKTKK